MPETQPIHPAQRDPSDLVSYDDIAPFIFGLSKENVRQLVLAERFPPGMRASPKRPLLHRAGAVAAWIAERSAVLDEPK